jgi:hypothetical protein
MPVTITEELGGTIGDLNVALAGALGFLYPLGAQIDAMIALGLGPLEFDLALQFDAALAAQATLSLQIGNPLVALELAIAALAQLQAALQAALALPPITLSIGAELSAAAALSGALAAKLGGLKATIAVALAVKIPAMQLAGQFMAALSLGDIILESFTGGTLAETGAALGGHWSSAISATTPVPTTINPGDAVQGIILVTAAPSAYAGLELIMGI